MSETVTGSANMWGDKTLGGESSRLEVSGIDSAGPGPTLGARQKP